MTSGLTDLSDADLVAAIRAGDNTALGVLYERHAPAAHSLARRMVRSTMDAEDAVSDAFLNVWSATRNGRGPNQSFRAYLMTAVRRAVYELSRDKVSPVDDITGYVEARDARIPCTDSVIARAERRFAAEAYARLPLRWQNVLRYTELENMPPAQVAPLIGLTANGVGAVARRAREGLTQQYLRAHLATPVAGLCAPVIEQLAAWTRKKLADRDVSKVAVHLQQCTECQARVAELVDVNAELVPTRRTAA